MNTITNHNIQHSKILKKIYMVFISFFINFNSASAFDQKIVGIVENHLNSLQTVVADFKQVGPEDGMVRSGKLYISKPGKIRWEYTNPKHITIVISDGKVSYLDHELDELTKVNKEYNLSKLLSAKTIKISKEMNVLSSIEKEDYVELLLEGKKREDREGQYRYLAINCQKKPIFRITKMILIGSSGDATEISLANLKTNDVIDPTKFSLRDEKFFDLRD